MTLDDLQEIRAMLAAQTADPEPRAPGLLQRLGSMLAGQTPPIPAKPLSIAAFDEARANPGQSERDKETAAVLLEPLDDLDLFAPAENLARLEFGQRPPRPYLPRDHILTLTRKVEATPRRLVLMTPMGQSVGELYLTADEVPHKPNADDHLNEAPYFEEDYRDANPEPDTTGKTLSVAVPGVLASLAVMLEREQSGLATKILQICDGGMSAVSAG